MQSVMGLVVGVLIFALMLGLVASLIGGINWAIEHEDRTCRFPGCRTRRKDPRRFRCAVCGLVYCGMHVHIKEHLCVLCAAQAEDGKKGR